MVKLSDFDVKDFDFNDPEKYDDFDRDYRFLVVLGIETEAHYKRVKTFCQTPELIYREYGLTLGKT